MRRRNHSGMGKYIEEAIAVESGFWLSATRFGDGLHSHAE
jgi:hypothetical protein